MKRKLLMLMFCSLLALTGYGQSKKVTGKVSDEKGVAIPGVSVIVQGGGGTAQTDLYGNFTLTVDKGKTVMFKSIGYKEYSVQIGNENTLNIILEESVRELDGVVVVGYGTLKKEAITGSVSSITAADIEKRPVTNALVALGGSAPGIQLNNSYGEPGTAPSIRIRGYGSINGTSSPLIVVDNAIYSGSINDINPIDIESISVLKDATSASLYGSKGSNGVIIITTKKGKNSTPTINAVLNQGWYTRGIAEYDKVTPAEYMEVAWLGYRNQLMTNNSALTQAQANATASANLVSTFLKTNIFNAPDNQLFDANGKLVTNEIKGTYAEDLNWFDPITRSGNRSDFNLNGQSGNEKSSLYYSMGYLDEEGYIKTSDYTRYSGRVSGNLNPKSYLRAGFTINGAYSIANNTTGSGSGFTTPWNYARNVAPIYPVHAHDLSTGNYILDADGNQIYDNGVNSRLQYVGRHVIWENELNMDRTFQTSLNSQAFVEVNFLKNFKFNTTLSDLLRNSEQRTYNNGIIGDGQGNNGRGSRTIYRRNEFTLQEQLTYKKSFGKHNFDALLGHENYYYRYNYLYGYKANQTFAGQVDLVNFSQITSLTDYEHNDRTESYLGRLRYNYNEKYYLEGTYRNDGTSRLHPDNRWGSFWAVGGTWIVSKENFFSSINSVVNDLKLRGSYGQTGNIASVGLYGYKALYSLVQNQNNAAFIKSQNENPELQWEGQRARSFALEGRFFNRLNLTAEYFDKGSDGLIFDVNLPLSAGATSSTSGVSIITKNIGKVRNSGIELSADVDILKDGNFKWNFGVNATFLSNKILSLPEENRANGIISTPFKYVEGRSVYDYFLYQYAGVDMMTGQALYYADDATYSPTNTTGAHYPFLVNINGVNYTRNASYAKRDWSGSAIPDVFGSFNTGLSYKNFSLSTTINYSIGGKGFDYSYISLMGVTSTPSSVHKDILKSWNGIPEGMTATSPDRINRDAVPQINYTNSQYNNNSVSNRFLFNNSSLIIRNVALGYDVPKSILSKLNIRKASINFLADNLATFSHMKGYSPEQTFGGYSENEFVPSRTFSIGLNIGL